MSLVLEITLTPALSRSTGRGGKLFAAPGFDRAKRSSRDAQRAAERVQRRGLPNCPETASNRSWTRSAAGARRGYKLSIGAANRL